MTSFAPELRDFVCLIITLVAIMEAYTHGLLTLTAPLVVTMQGIVPTRDSKA